MAPRTSWKGFLKLSLVSVPVKAFTAHNTGEEIRLNQLHEECNARVKYQKICPEHGELKQSDIVSGYQYAKDQYVVIDTSELSKLRLQSDKAIRIDGFISPDEIDPLYHAGKTYYLLPDGIAGDKPYALLHKGMIDADVCAIAQIILSGREQLVVVRPLDGMLVMTVLNYPKKIKASDEFTKELEDQDFTRDEIKLTKTLIDASLIEDFKLDSYKDEYVEHLAKLIQLKVDGQEIVQSPDPEEPKIINLMEALKKSVAEAQAGRKVAPSVKETKRKAAKKKPAAKKKRTRKKKTG